MNISKLGETVVSDRGIEKIVDVGNFTYTSKILITKEAFIEAYNKWIKCNNNEIYLSLNKKKEKPYTRKDIIKILIDTRDEILKEKDWKTCMASFYKAIDDAVNIFNYYIAMDNDDPESYVKKYTNGDVYDQFWTIRLEVENNERVYSGENKEDYTLAADRVLRIIDRQMEKYNEN